MKKLLWIMVFMVMATTCLGCGGAEDTKTSSQSTKTEFELPDDEF